MGTSRVIIRCSHRSHHERPVPGGGPCLEAFPAAALASAGAPEHSAAAQARSMVGRLAPAESRSTATGE
eukprot:363900-Chlamydomonas_euryale.AAC.11